MVGRGPIVVPRGEVSQGVNGLGDGLCLRSKTQTSAVNPDVLSDDGASLVKVLVAVVSEKLVFFHSCK